MSFHQYDNIDRTRHGIRLVEVLPELSNGIVSCRLHHTILKSNYACLSYTWGSSLKPHQILINGRAFFVATTLHRFLHVASRTRSRIPLWIDAICINQADLRERGHQVELMGQIYRGAKEVLVWLGDENPECEDLLNLISEQDRLSFGLLPISKARMKIDGLSSYDMDRTDNVFKALNNICRLAYWNRIWTVQEFILAQNIILMYGSTELDIEPFRIFLVEWTNPDHKNPPPHMKMIESSEGFKAYYEERVRFQQSRHTQVSLSSLLYSFYKSQCTDQEDRIYALLSLAKRGEEFQVDYREPTVRLLFRTLCFCKPETVQEVARLSSLLMSILALEPEEQRLVQDFVIEAQRLSKSDEPMIHLPASALKVCFLHGVDLADYVSTVTIGLGCPSDYKDDPEAKHLFDFVTRGSDSKTQSDIYLVSIDFLSTDLELVVRPQESNIERFLVVGVAIPYPSQTTDYVYILMAPEKLTGISIQRAGLQSTGQLALECDQLLCLLDYMQYQEDAWREELVISDIYFGNPQEVLFRSCSNNLDDDALKFGDTEDSTLRP